MSTFAIVMEGWNPSRHDIVDSALRSLASCDEFLGSWEGNFIPSQTLLEASAHDLTYDESERLFQDPSTPTLIQFYFQNQIAAEAFATQMRERLQALNVEELLRLSLQEIDDQDWNRPWVESFRDCVVKPYWKIELPSDELNIDRTHIDRLPIDAPQESDPTVSSDIPLCRILLNPSVGFGSGSHATTALCLRQIGDWSVERSLVGANILDFGSGSGILALAAALKGAHVTAVEIDEMALDHSRAMAALNGVSSQIRFQSTCPDHARYDFIVANILMQTLLDYAPLLLSQLKPGGQMALSGLLVDQVGDVEQRYVQIAGSLGHTMSTHLEQDGDWCLLRLLKP